MSKNRSNKDWQQRQNSDPYVIKSKKQGYRSRAAYKLLEINQKDHILKPGMVVVDLGASPGGWSQVATQIVGATGRVIAVDLLEIEPINNNNFYFIHGDFTSEAIYKQLIIYLENNNLTQKVDLVISDMAPNLTGNKTADQARSSYLVHTAYEFACEVLKPKGVFLTKFFYGSEFEALSKEIKNNFDKLLIRKPKSSRDSSKEAYILAQGFNG